MLRMPYALFLHGGPGMNSEVERRWYGDALPIVWWDQPTHSDGAGEWIDVASSALARKISEMANAGGSPISIVAHSFGGLLARRAAEAHPDLVRDLVLLGPGISLTDQFLRVGEHLLAAADYTDATQLRAAVDSARARPDMPSLLQLAGAIAATSGWRSAYFSPRNRAALEQYVRLLPEGAPVDFATFTAGAGEHLASPPVAAPSRFRGRVRVLIGTDDVLIDAAVVMPFWRQVFEQVEFALVPAGHMVQFELPPSHWLPERDSLAS